MEAFREAQRWEQAACPLRNPLSPQTMLAISNMLSVEWSLLATVARVVRARQAYLHCDLERLSSLARARGAIPPELHPRSAQHEMFASVKALCPTLYSPT